MEKDSIISRAIVLKRQAYRESDLLVQVFSEKLGRLNLVAKGARKAGSKLAAHLEPFNRIEALVVSGRNYDYVASAASDNTRFHLKQDLNKIYFAGRAAAWLLDTVKESEAEPVLFFLLDEYLTLLDTLRGEFKKEQGSLLSGFFQLKALAILGYRPELYHCVRSGREIVSGHNLFSLLDGGLVASVNFTNIEEKDATLLTISDNCIKLLRLGLDLDFSQLSKLAANRSTTKEFSQFLRSFTLYNFPLVLKN